MNQPIKVPGLKQSHKDYTTIRQLLWCHHNHVILWMCGATVTRKYIPPWAAKFRTPITSSLSPNWMALLCCEAPWGSWSGSHWRRTWHLASISLSFSWWPVRAWLRISSKPALVIQTARIFSCPFFVAQPDRYIIQRKLGLIQDILLYENLSPPNLLHSMNREVQKAHEGYLLPRVAK